MTIPLVNPSTWGVGDKLTSAQQNQLDENVTFAYDVRPGEVAVIESVGTLSGEGRIIDTVAIGVDADTAYNAGDACKVIQVTTAVLADRVYTLDDVGAVMGDSIAIFCEPDFLFEIDVQDQAAASMYTLGNQATSDGAWATFVYIGGWRLHKAGPAKEFTETFLADGNFTVPAGVFRVCIEGCGGGGGGAGGNSLSPTTVDRLGTGGGGGGGALFCSQVISVTPGDVIAVDIGAGGAANTDGSDTTFGGSPGLAAFAGAGRGHGGDVSANLVRAVQLGGLPVRLESTSASVHIEGGISTDPVFQVVPAGGGCGFSVGVTGKNGQRNPYGGFAAGSGGTSGTTSTNYYGGGGGGGGGAGPYGAGANGGNGGNGNNAGVGGSGTNGTAAAANTGAGGGGGGALGQGTSAGSGGAGAAGGSGQLTVRWVK